jgi:8-oxo-dGTP diphosphatase
MAQLNPHISADCVIFGFNDQHLKVLLVERDMIRGSQTTQQALGLKLPGGLVYNDELLIDASARILKELTGLTNVRLTQFGVLDSLARMENEADRLWLEQTSGMTIDRVISIAYYGITELDQYTTIHPTSRWVTLDLTHNLPFDHEEIINKALIFIRQSLKREGMVFELLGEKFTINQLQNLLELFYEEKTDSRNFRKKIKKMDFIVPLDEKQTNVAHKPAQLFRFDQQRFAQFRNTRIIF